MKKYITPKTDIILLRNSTLLCDSVGYEYISKCNKYCKLWHFCIDREEGKLVTIKIRRVDFTCLENNKLDFTQESMKPPVFF